MKKECFVELWYSLILLGIASAHKYVDSLIIKSPSTAKHSTQKRKKRKRKGAHERQTIKEISFLLLSCFSLPVPLLGLCFPILGPKRSNSKLRLQVVPQVLIPLFGVYIPVLGPKRPNSLLCSQVILQIIIPLFCMYDPVSNPKRSNSKPCSQVILQIFIQLLVCMILL